MTGVATRLDCSTLPQPVSLGIARMPSSTPLPEHELTLFELNFISSGSYTLLLDGEPQRAQAGHVYGYRPGDVASSPGGAEGGELVCRWVKFSWPERRGAGKLRELPRETPLDAAQQRHFTAAFDRLLELHLGRVEARLAMAALLLELVGIAIESPAERVVDRRLARALELIDRDFAKPLALRELAAAAGLTDDYFTRLFRRELGLPPMQHLIRTRLAEARRLLAGEAAIGVAEAASRSGFDDAGHFARLFRRHYGVAPREFRSRLA